MIIGEYELDFYRNTVPLEVFCFLLVLLFVYYYYCNLLYELVTIIDLRVTVQEKLQIFFGLFLSRVGDA